MVGKGVAYVFKKALVKHLVEAVKLVLGALSRGEDIVFVKPFDVQIGIILIFDEIIVFFGVCAFFFAAPQNDINVGAEDAVFFEEIVVIGELSVLRLIFAVFIKI